MSVAAEIHERILANICELERAHEVKVLYACESGSRAWGFASPDSDWDVRLFFVHPQAEYLRVHPPKDHLHVDFPGEIDLTGWDLRKALHHAAKSSASVLEWLRSPIVYLDREGFAEQMSATANACFRIKPTVHHYLGLAKQLWAQAGEGAELNGKKCLYVMRATLCAHWALTYGTPPPVAFAELLPLVTDSHLREEIQRFVTLKQAALEQDALPVSVPLRDFLSDLRLQCEHQQAALTVDPVAMRPLDLFFQQILAGTPLPKSQC